MQTTDKQTKIMTLEERIAQELANCSIAIHAYIDPVHAPLIEFENEGQVEAEFRRRHEAAVKLLAEWLEKYPGGKYNPLA